MKVLLALLFLIPLTAIGAPVILVNAIPSGAMLVDYAQIRPPFEDLRTADPKVLVSGLTSALRRVAADAQQRGATHVCLLSSVGKDGMDFVVPEANQPLRLSFQKSIFSVVLYRKEEDAGQTNPDITYSLEEPDPGKPHVHVSFKKISLPEGYPTAAWIYFNLTRIQQAAAKDGATKIFIKASGTGERSDVFLPGPALSVPDTDTVLEATWYATESSKPEPGISRVQNMSIVPGTNASP